MPYEGERAVVTNSLKRLLESPKVAALKNRLQRAAPRAGSQPVTPCQLERPNIQRLPKLVIAIDGSQGAIAMEDGFPGAEVGVVTVASVFIDLDKLRAVRDNGMPDPRRFKDLHTKSGIEMLLPSTNMVLDTHVDARSSYRAELFHNLNETRVLDDGETLLETYEVLLAARQDSGSGKLGCPLLDSCGHKDAHYRAKPGSYLCNCEEQSMYSTDALRIHEAFMDSGSNQTVITESRSVVEHLVLINLLRYFERYSLWRSINSIAFVMDGPLAVSGHPAWMAMSIKRELLRITDVCRTAIGSVPTIFGIEKTGLFQDHLALLDRPQRKPRTAGQHPDPRTVRPASHLKPGDVILVNDAYVKQNIIYKYEPEGSEQKAYGSTSHYGRKALYKTKTGALITVMSAFLRPGDDAMIPEAHSDQFPNLPTILSLLDTLVSNSYSNATIPLIVAHAEAAIPARANESVLRQFLQESRRSVVETSEK